MPNPLTARAKYNATKESIINYAIVIIAALTLATMLAFSI